MCILAGPVMANCDSTVVVRRHLHQVHTVVKSCPKATFWQTGHGRFVAGAIAVGAGFVIGRLTKDNGDTYVVAPQKCEDPKKGW